MVDIIITSSQSGVKAILIFNILFRCIMKVQVFIGYNKN